MQTKFGGKLSRFYNEFRNEKAGLLVQAMTARNSGTVGTYLFKVTEKQRVELSGAKRAFLALGFHDRREYLLVPWNEVDPVLSSLPESRNRYGAMWQLTLHADAGDLLKFFGRYRHFFHQD